MGDTPLPNAFDLGYGDEADDSYGRISEEEIAEEIGIPFRELSVWLAAHPDFERELRRGQRARDHKNLLSVEEAAFDSAKGVMETRLVKKKDGSMEREEIYIPPSPKSQEFLLTTLNAERFTVPEDNKKLVAPQVLIQINERLTSKGRPPLEISGGVIAVEKK